jgi:hypothetical protein
LRNESDHLLPASWKERLLDYEQLKRRLETASLAAQNQEETAVADFVKKSTRNSFQHLLDSEIEKVLAHYKQHSATLVNDVENLRRETTVLSDRLALGDSEDEHAATHKDIKRLADMWVTAAKYLENILLYLSLCTEGIRKIMKKYAKSDCKKVSGRSGLSMLRIDHQSLIGGFVEQGSFLPAESIEAINEMKDHTELVAASQAIKDALLQLDVMKTLVQQKKVSFMRLPVSYNASRSVHASVKALKESIYHYADLSPIISSLAQAHERARNNLNVIQAHSRVLESQVGIFHKAPDRGVATLPGLIMNLLSAFLYMANYNLVLPTNEEFCLHVGSYGSMAGVVVGLADFTAIGVALLYGWWSNTSFKQPLIASALFSVAGNVLYCLAWDAGGSLGLPLLLAGRLLTGAGSARAINRRYIADFVSSKGRTAASAAFVAASAAGAAVGPLLAFPLSMIKGTLLFGRFSWNPVTSGGWIMASCWLVFSAYVYLNFVDPPIPEDSSDDDEDEGTNRSQGAIADSEGGLKEPLLGNHPSEGSISNLRPVPEQSSFDMQPAYVCILSLFALKLMQQGVISSVPEFTDHFYHWSSSIIGVYLSTISLAVLPVNFLVAIVSSLISDRNLLFFSEGVSVLGLLCLLSYSGAAPNLYIYIAGTLLVYAATIVMECVSMSLLSKKIPKRGGGIIQARGTCNAGVIATQSGSFGRFVGNMLITVYGGVLGGHMDYGKKIVQFDWLLNGTLLVAGAFTLLYTLATYKRLKTATSSSS